MTTTEGLQRYVIPYEDGFIEEIRRDFPFLAVEDEGRWGDLLGG